MPVVSAIQGVEVENGLSLRGRDCSELRLGHYTPSWGTEQDRQKKKKIHTHTHTQTHTHTHKHRERENMQQKTL